MKSEIMGALINLGIFITSLWAAHHAVKHWRVDAVLKRYKNMQEEYNAFKNATSDSNLEYLCASYLNSLEITAQLIIRKLVDPKTARNILKTWFDNISKESFGYIREIRATKNSTAYENIIKLLSIWKISPPYYENPFDENYNQQKLLFKKYFRFTEKIEMKSPRELKQEVMIENWKRVWQCRDFEISHLWQRSVFLTAFLLLIYSGYGALWKGILLMPNYNAVFNKVHIISIAICAVGVIVSVLWIMMAKGSKFFYECYEEKIKEIECNSSFLNAYDVRAASENVNKNKNILSSHAGHFSVSRVNIVIGQISFILWVFLMILHISLYCNRNKLPEYLWIIFIPVLCILGILWCLKSTKSSHEER